MSPQTKRKPLVKLHAVTNKIGKKAHWLTYSTVKITRDDAYGNSERASAFEWPASLAKSASRWTRPTG